MREVLIIASFLFSAPSASRALPGRSIKGTGVSVGDPIRVANLSVFPIYGADIDLGPMVSLEAALETGQAVVREQGPSSPTVRNPPAHLPNAAPVQQMVQRVPSQAGASVGTLVIENHSEASLVVLAGTVVRGGKQDRQIGQDFVIGPRQTVPVDAFCVEQGRWSGTRSGKSTAGKFEATELLAPQAVRAAGQYEGNQSKVWAKVAAVNQENRKKTASGTLMATYDDAQIAAERKTLANQVTAQLDALPTARHIVGLAYAVDEKVHAARWFFAHALFRGNRRKLINTAAVEAVTAPAVPASAKPNRPVSSTDVLHFIEAIRTAKVNSRKKTRSLNENVYRESRVGYSSEAVIIKDGKKVPVTTDFLMH